MNTDNTSLEYIKAPSSLVTALIEKGTDLPPSDLTSKLITLALIRIGNWPSDFQMKDRLRQCLFSREISARRKVEIILRLSKFHINECYDILKELSNSKEAQVPDVCRKLAFVTLLKSTDVDLNKPNTEIINLISVFNTEHFYTLDFIRTLGSELFYKTQTFQLFQSIYLKEYVKVMGEYIHKLKARDTTGRWAYYFVLVEDHLTGAFMETIGGDGTIDLEDYGKVIASCYGEEPTPTVRNFLKEEYGFDV